jgi:hypothetical protein
VIASFGNVVANGGYFVCLIAGGVLFMVARNILRERPNGFWYPQIRASEEEKVISIFMCRKGTNPRSLRHTCISIHDDDFRQKVERITHECQSKCNDLNRVIEEINSGRTPISGQCANCERRIRGDDYLCAECRDAA